VIQHLANALYIEQTIRDAAGYLATRGVDATAMRFPPVLAGKDSAPFRSLGKYLPPHLFTETIYFPITDIESPTTLVGFDARYLGDDPSRLRYRKFKTESTQFLLYYSHPLQEIPPDTPLIVTEGIVDAETIRPLGFPVVSALTAMHSFKFLCFLKAISNNIYFGYDSDKAGISAIKSIESNLQISSEFAACFKTLNFRGKDLNDSYLRYGRDYLFNILQSQLF